MDKWKETYNSYRRRKDHKSTLPTGCSANWCYENPSEFEGLDGLIPVDMEAITCLENEFYPEKNKLLATTPEWFTQVVQTLTSTFNISLNSVTTQNVWDIFTRTHEAIQAYDVAWLTDTSNDPSQTVLARVLAQD